MTGNGARPMGRMVADLAPRQTVLSGVCPDLEPCGLPVACSRLCWRLEAELIQAEMRADAVLAGGRKVE